MTEFTMGPALLFCPADRPERFGKAAERADAVILDLEDAVAPDRKAGAREALISHPLDPAKTIVRVNPAQSHEFARDLQALRETKYRTVMLAKTEGCEDLWALNGFDVVALCETARGVQKAGELAEEPNVVALMWGAEDLVASLGGTASRKDDGGYRHIAMHARSTVLLAAAAAGKQAVDAVYVNIPDIEGLTEEARDAVASGFGMKACIHPSQVQVIREAYKPSADEEQFAREVLAEAEHHDGVFTFRGKMVDEPILRHAEQTLRRAERP